MANGVNVVVPYDRYQDLLTKEKILDALEAAGVDNWEGYEEVFPLEEIEDK